MTSPDAASATAGAELIRQYERHLDEKVARVRALLGGGGLAPLFHGIERCPVERGYRTRATFGYATPGDGRLTGVDPRTGRQPWESTLWVLPEGMREQVRAVERVLAGSSLATALTGFEMRLEYGSGRAHVLLGVPRAAGVDVLPLCDELLARVPDLLGVSVPSQGIELREAYLRHRLLGKVVLSHYLAFFQTNLWLTPELVKEAQREVHQPASIVDLYCGVGLHAVHAAHRGSRIIGTDNNRWAIQSALRNAELHGLQHARFCGGSVEALLEEEQLTEPDVVFVNPSRLGCSPGVPQAVAGWRPHRIVLVSCSIDSHVRDTLALAGAGYRPRGVRCFDMFPFSEFLESVTVFEPG
ncbi:MAG TPA: methyltransferase domain-containing protein [Longimicrobium sp.]|nr:methyltransferase domain-containing protein [Longimicrobium sp.]